MNPYGFLSANVLEFKRINRIIRLNLVHERLQTRKHSPKVNIYVLIIAGRNRPKARPTEFCHVFLCRDFRPPKKFAFIMVTFIVNSGCEYVQNIWEVQNTLCVNLRATTQDQILFYVISKLGLDVT